MLLLHSNLTQNVFAVFNTIFDVIRYGLSLLCWTTIGVNHGGMGDRCISQNLRWGWLYYHPPIRIVNWTAVRPPAQSNRTRLQ